MLVIDPISGLVSFNNEQAFLSKKEMRMFMLLYRHQGKNVSRDAIMEFLYSSLDRQPHMKILDVFMCRARKKLESLNISIRTVWGFGYRLEMEPHEAPSIIGSIDVGMTDD